MTTGQKWLLAVVLVVFLIGGAVLFGMMMLLLLPGARSDGLTAGFGPRVGVIELEGVIEDSRWMVRRIEEFRKDDQVRAVVLRIDSPGGGVAPTQEIFEELLRLREQGKPVVVSMGSIAASGGYYLACAGDSVLANPGTLTGSIGVILEFADLQEVLRKVGVEFRVVKSGVYKDIGSPFREMTADERQLLQAMIEDVYQQFVEAVTDNRPLPRDSVLALADGRIFSGRQAAELGLVDRTGTYQEAIRVAGLMSGLGEEPRIVRPTRERIPWRDLMTETAARLGDPVATVAGSPRLLYLFR